MMEWESGMPLGSQLSVASLAFSHDVIVALPSDLDEGLERPSLGIEVRSHVNAMSIEMLSAEICCMTDFVARQDFMNFMVRGR